ncbi:putative reverse transcriptase domain-containing protein, partial [Tanacetum coccineum]
LGTPKPINMVIEMADKSMQSLKGIAENVLVKIDKFIFPVDFVILDVMEDNKVPIILGRPMLATDHARIDIFVPKEFEESKGLEVFLINDDINGDLRDLLEENDLLPKIVWDTLEVLLDSNDEIGIRLTSEEDKAREEEPALTTGETFAPPAPKTAKQLAARRNREIVKSILLLAIPDEYLLKFHNIVDAKSL